VAHEVDILYSIKYNLLSRAVYHVGLGQGNDYASPEYLLSMGVEVGLADGHVQLVMALQRCPWAPLCLPIWPVIFISGKYIIIHTSIFPP
jgi:hypothetical protein